MSPVPGFGISAHGFIAPTSQEAIRLSYPAVAFTMNRIGRERGWRPMTFEDDVAGCALDGAYFVGSPEQVVEKILFQHEIFRHDRLLLQFSVGTRPHTAVMRAIELFGTKVAPAVRKALAGSVDPAPPRR